MADKEQADALIRIISNRCRNLRKVIDRARALQVAESKGQQLNEEQRESLRGLARKEALLAELQEIFRKQNAIVHPPVEAPQKLSRRAQKAARAKARELEGKTKNTGSEMGSDEGDRGEGRGMDTTAEGKQSKEAVQEEKKEAEKIMGDRVKNSYEDEDRNGNHEEKGDEKETISNADVSLPVVDNENDITGPNGMQEDDKAQKGNNNIEMSAEEREVLLREMADLKLQHEHQLLQCRAEVVRSTLNLFHVAEFLRQPGSREALLAYYASVDRTHPQQIVLNGLHLDLISYFYVMLTSPNGNVPHPEAVQVSTAHCMGFLQGSNSDAFKDTPYSLLVEIVNNIATCPILTERGSELGEDIMGAAFQKMGDRIKPSNATGARNNEPGHVVDNAVTNTSHS